MRALQQVFEGPTRLFGRIFGLSEERLRWIRIEMTAAQVERLLCGHELIYTTEDNRTITLVLPL